MGVCGVAPAADPHATIDPPPPLLSKQTRAEDAAVGAICSPLLDFPIKEAGGVIFNIVGGLDLSLTEARLNFEPSPRGIFKILSSRVVRFRSSSL